MLEIHIQNINSYKNEKSNKASAFSCGIIPAKKEEPKTENIGKWHDPVDNPRLTKYNSGE